MLKPPTRRSIIIAAFVGWFVLVVFAIVGNAAAEKVTICHAAGLEGTTKYVTITVAEPAVYGPAGHFEENGTPQAGHEQDYFGECEQPQEPQRYVLRRLMPQGRDAATVDSQPPLTWSCAGGFEAGPLQLDIVNHKLGSAARLFLKLDGERILVDQLGYPGGTWENRIANRPWQFGENACF